MVKSTKTHVDEEEAVVAVEEEEEETEDYDDVVARNNSSSSSYREMKGKSIEQKSNAYRSKHSETEQRRRSKINERFQLLRNLIPQNDQRRDKASFLLEVIEYIQFLQEKLRMYEETYQGWSQEPAKLMPWRNHHGPAESSVDHPQVFKNGSGHENNVVTPAMLTTPHNSLESDLGTAAAYKALDHPPGSTIPLGPITVQTQSNMFALTGKSTVPTQTLPDSISDMENLTYQSQPHLWPVRPGTMQCVRNNTPNAQDMATENGSVSTSNAFTQGVLNSLTQVLQSSGVDLSQTSISVQIDVAKQANSGPIVESSSRDTEKQYLNEQVMAQTGVQSFVDDSDQARKRLRTERS